MDLGRTVAFLSSPQSSYINGERLRWTERGGIESVTEMERNPATVLFQSVLVNDVGREFDAQTGFGR
jgi:hypothetical protein